MQVQGRVAPQKVPFELRIGGRRARPPKGIYDHDDFVLTTMILVLITMILGLITMILGLITMILILIIMISF